MRIKISAELAAACSAFIIFFSVNIVMSQSHDEAIPIGKAIKTQINCSKRAGGIEAYDATITLLEVIRGPKAWKLLKKADHSNQKPDEGYEYILVRVSFKMKARGAPGDKTFDLDSPLQFTAFSEDFEEYETPTVVLPKPELKRTVSADQYAEGWIALIVKKQDRRPLLMFDPSSGGAWSRGKILFFRLYNQ
jgi:hypothetical protein